MGGYNTHVQCAARETKFQDENGCGVEIAYYLLTSTTDLIRLWQSELTTIIEQVR
jgi:hypothetical protein